MKKFKNVFKEDLLDSLLDYYDFELLDVNEQYDVSKDESEKFLDTVFNEILQVNSRDFFYSSTMQNILNKSETQSSNVPNSKKANFHTFKSSKALLDLIKIESDNIDLKYGNKIDQAIIFYEKIA